MQVIIIAALLHCVAARASSKLRFPGIRSQFNHLLGN